MSEKNRPTPGPHYLARYKEAKWRNTLPVFDQFIGVGFTRSTGEDIFLRIPLESARHLAQSILDGFYIHLGGTFSHSDKSSGIPSSPVSMPKEIENVCPPDKSSAACSGVV